MIAKRILAHDAAFWRRLAHLGASRFPEWWVRYSPPFFGWAAALAVPAARRAVVANLRRVRGEAGAARDAVDVAKLYATYASCLAEVLSNNSKNARDPEALVYGTRRFDSLLEAGRGAIVATLHTAGWEMIGPLLARDRKVDLVLVMQRERDENARELHDNARTMHGVQIAHVGDDPLAALPLLQHLRKGGLVALQIDRAGDGMKTRAVRMFDGPGAIPEGALKLAQLSGAPIVPIFSTRMGYRRYEVRIAERIEIARDATEAALDRAAQALADAVTEFVRAHPAQWFRFQPL